MLIKTLGHLFVNDNEGKPVAIHQFIGRRPTVCCGNSDGDLAMLQYTTINNPRPSFGLIVHHTDAQREYAYDAKTKSTGKLVAALDEPPHAAGSSSTCRGTGTPSSPLSQAECRTPPGGGGPPGGGLSGDVPRKVRGNIQMVAQA